MSASQESGLDTPSPTAGIFWDGLAAGELRFQKCGGCGKVRHPPASACAVCGAEGWDVVTGSIEGVVHSWAIPRLPDAPSPPTAKDRCVVLVDLALGPRILGHYENGGAATPAIGDAVTGRIDRFGSYPIVIFARKGG